MDDICLNCGQEVRPALWGGKCSCDNPNVVHQEKCHDCDNVLGCIIDDDYCSPDKLYCSECLNKARRNK